jgi:hypothetical protein
MGQLTLRNLTFRDNTISVSQMGELVDLVESRRVTGIFCFIVHCILVLTSYSRIIG